MSNNKMTAICYPNVYKQTNADHIRNMSAYIKREDVLALVDKGYLVGNRNYNSVTKLINSIPSADVERKKWIPVTERLPSFGEDVLILISGFANVGHLVQTNDEKQYNWFYSGWYHDPWEVTHWMPLPEPPKEGE